MESKIAIRKAKRKLKDQNKHRQPDSKRTVGHIFWLKKKMQIALPKQI